MLVLSLALRTTNVGFGLRLNLLRCVHPSDHTSTFHKDFFQFQYLIWCVGKSRPDMSTSMTLTESKVNIKVTGLLKFRTLQFSRSISSAIFAWSSKLMADHHSMGPSLQLAGA